MPKPSDKPTSIESSSAASIPSRRRFIQSGTAVTAGVATGLATTRAVRGAEPQDDSRDLVRIGVVGCGGRGGGAIGDNLSINDYVKIVALADLEGEKLPGLRNSISKRFEDKVAVADDKMKNRPYLSGNH